MSGDLGEDRLFFNMPECAHQMYFPVFHYVRRGELVLHMPVHLIEFIECGGDAFPGDAVEIPVKPGVAPVVWFRPGKSDDMKVGGSQELQYGPSVLPYIIVYQEIYAKLTLYNFSSFVASVVGRERRSGSGSTFRLDFSRVQKICIRFLKGLVADPYDLIRRYLVPVRLGRSFPRNLRRQSADTLNYR